MKQFHNRCKIRDLKKSETKLETIKQKIISEENHQFKVHAIETNIQGIVENLVSESNHETALESKGKVISKLDEESIFEVKHKINVYTEHIIKTENKVEDKSIPSVQINSEKLVKPNSDTNNADDNMNENASQVKYEESKMRNIVRAPVNKIEDNNQTNEQKKKIIKSKSSIKKLDESIIETKVITISENKRELSENIIENKDKSQINSLPLFDNHEKKVNIEKNIKEEKKIQLEINKGKSNENDDSKRETNQSKM